MSRNGQRRPPRPRIELITPTPSKGEAAAIATAIERFLADTAPAPGEAARSHSAWQRAAIREGVSARTALTAAWGADSG